MAIMWLLCGYWAANKNMGYVSRSSSHIIEGISVDSPTPMAYAAMKRHSAMSVSPTPFIATPVASKKRATAMKKVLIFNEDER